MANLNGKKASEVEALLLDRNDFKTSFGETVNNRILVSEGSEIIGEDTVPKVVSKDLIDAINDGQKSKLITVKFSNVQEGGSNTLTVNNAEATINTCKNCYKVINSINDVPISDILLNNTSTVKQAETVTENIKWTYSNQDHELSLSNLFGNGIILTSQNKSGILEGYDRSKGSIESRLTTLATNVDEATKITSYAITSTNSEATISFHKQNKFVYGKVSIPKNNVKTVKNGTIFSFGNLSVPYPPTEVFSCIGAALYTLASASQTKTYLGVTFSIDANNHATLQYSATDNASNYIMTNDCVIAFGYEAK